MTAVVGARLASTTLPTQPDAYPALLVEPEQRIRKAHVKVALAVNAQFVMLYWAIGRDILEMRLEGYGPE